MNTITPTDRLRGAMDRDRVTVEITPEGSHTDRDGWMHSRYRFTLAVRGEVLINAGTFRAGLGFDAVTPVDVFGSILMDCASVEPYANDDADEARNVWPQTRSAWPPGWDEWADGLDLISGAASRGELRKVADNFREIMNRRALLRHELGAATYEQLLEIAGEL